MKIITANKSEFKKIVASLRIKKRQEQTVQKNVARIIQTVKRNGDAALKQYTEKFDGIRLASLRASREEIDAAYAAIDPQLLRALKQAKRNIEKFHATAVRRREPIVETMPGVEVWREFRPIEQVGLYIPGGLAAYPSTVLMLAIPARIASCKEIVLCSPAGTNGINPAVLVAADLCGVSQIFKIGGAQAIAAMAYGTETVPQVQKIFGPGNQYVTTAKMLVYGDVDIDMPAGPSEVCAIADERANPEWLAADLLSQLEHGTDSQAILITTSENVARKVLAAMKEQMKALRRGEIIKKSLQRSAAIIVESIDAACDLANEYAPEHLELVVTQPRKLLKKINNVGSIFLGPYSSEPLGDYATGANHTLPTNGKAAMFSALSTESFGKMMQIQEVSKKGIRTLRKTVEVLATSEGLDAHAKAISIRFGKPTTK